MLELADHLLVMRAGRGVAAINPKETSLRELTDFMVGAACASKIRPVPGGWRRTVRWCRVARSRHDCGPRKSAGAKAQGWRAHAGDRVGDVRFGPLLRRGGRDRGSRCPGGGLPALRLRLRLRQRS